MYETLKNKNKRKEKIFDINKSDEMFSSQNI